MGSGRGGSSPDRSPNDDRSDVMNPNNDAYWYDQANRGGSDDCGAGGESIRRSEHERRVDRFLDRIQRNEARRHQARRDLKEAERRYGDETLPYDIAREQYQKAERNWKAARNGERAYGEAATWWQLARMEQSCLEPGESFPDFFWELQGVGPEEGARIAALDAAAYALVEARLHQGQRVIESGELALEKTIEAWDAYQDPRVSGEHSDEEFFENEARLREAWDRASELLGSGQSDDAQLTDSEAWAPYEQAKYDYCKAHALAVVKAEEQEWNAAKTAWKAAGEANLPAQEALEGARRRWAQESDACGAEAEAIDRARRR